MRKGFVSLVSGIHRHSFRPPAQHPLDTAGPSLLSPTGPTPPVGNPHPFRYVLQSRVRSTLLTGTPPHCHRVWAHTTPSDSPHCLPGVSRHHHRYPYVMCVPWRVYVFRYYVVPSLRRVTTSVMFTTLDLTWDTPHIILTFMTIFEYQT